LLCNVGKKSEINMSNHSELQQIGTTGDSTM